MGLADEECININLLNIPFALGAVTLALAPLFVGMHYQSRDDEQKSALRHSDIFPPPSARGQDVRELAPDYEVAA